jgi:hypothetical protein
MVATDAAAPKGSPTAPSSPPFTLASSLPPIPDKLVCHIQSLEFVDSQRRLSPLPSKRLRNIYG